jgi:nicotinate-nucleotide--dimethylbenzimidazole phosphoribosyltransferase
VDRIKKIRDKITGLDKAMMQETQKRLDSLTKPVGSLGRLEDLAKQICGITGKANPLLKNKIIFTLAADHGITVEGVSAYPQEVTAQMVANFLSGGAAINVLSRHIGAKVVVADLGVATDLAADPKLVIKKIGYGTKNMARGPAMTREDAVKAVNAGIELFEEELIRGIDIAGTGEMGIGNTTASSAITACFTQKPVEDVTGKGAGLDEKGRVNKIALIKKALAVNRPDPKDPWDVLAKVGGFEIAGLTGIMLAAAANRIPVVIDGFISGAAALVAFHIEPKIKDYLIPAHNSVENGHKIILSHIGIQPLLNLGLRLGEGTGGSLAIGLADASIKILTQMATFQSANVSEKNQK